MQILRSRFKCLGSWESRVYGLSFFTVAIDGL